MFDFNASLNDFVPVSSMSLSFGMTRKEKSELLMDAFCVSFVFTFQIEASKCRV